MSKQSRQTLFSPPKKSPRRSSAQRKSASIEVKGKEKRTNEQAVTPAEDARSRCALSILSVTTAKGCPIALFDDLPPHLGKPFADQMREAVPKENLMRDVSGETCIATTRPFSSHSTRKARRISHQSIVSRAWTRILTLSKQA